MKRNILWVNGLVVMSLIIQFVGCKGRTSSEFSPYKHIFIEEEAYLNDDASSPYCDFSIDYSFLNEEDDSIAVLVNRNIQREFLGEDYATLVPEIAVDSFKNVYLANYLQEVGAIYQSDKKEMLSDESVPTWYNQTYSMVTLVEEGYGSIINVSADFFVDMGGAHPNQWRRWLNFDLVNGKQLMKENVFRSDYIEYIERILLEKLICQQADLNPEKKVESLEDLQKMGFLQMTDMYIPNNFILNKTGIVFLFNRYDIAPYSAGEIVIEIPFEEIGHCLNL